MITYSEIKKIECLDFMQYLKLPGFSHSFLKSERSGVSADILLTENIRIGKLVDGIFTDPGTVNMADPLYNVSREIVYFIEKQFGKLIKHFQPQVSYTAQASFQDFTMFTKGRLDWLLPNQAVIDLKITASRNIRNVIDFMGYKNQVFHYAKLAGVPTAYLLVHSMPLKKTELFKVDCSGNENQFWQEKIIHFGCARELIV